MRIEAGREYSAAVGKWDGSKNSMLDPPAQSIKKYAAGVLNRYVNHP